MPTTALLLMDLQARILDRFEADPGFVPRINAAAETARSAGFPVLWVKVGFRSGYPEVSPRNKAFSALSVSGGLADNDPGADLHPDLQRQDTDIVVVKKPSARLPISTSG